MKQTNKKIQKTVSLKTEILVALISFSFSLSIVLFFSFTKRAKIKIEIIQEVPSTQNNP